MGLLWKRALHGPALSGGQALLAATLIIAIPTAIRAALVNVIFLGVFLTYVPFVMLAAVLLRARDALIVALICALLADYWLMKPTFAIGHAPEDLFSLAFFMLISGMMIIIMASVRRYLADCINPKSQEQA